MSVTPTPTPTAPAKKPVINIAVVIAFVTPYLSIGGGLVVSWLFVHFHWLGVFHIQQSGVAKMIAGLGVFAVTSILTYAAAHFHWLPVVIQKLNSR